MKNKNRQKVFNVALIKNFMAQHNLTKTQLSKLSKISFGTINRILSDNTSVGICSIFRLSRFLNVHICDMFADEKIGIKNG